MEFDMVSLMYYSLICYDILRNRVLHHAPGCLADADVLAILLAISGPETGKLKMGKLKWVTKSVSFSCQDPPKFSQRVSFSVSFPSAFRQLSVSFSCYPFSLTRFVVPEVKEPHFWLQSLSRDVQHLFEVRQAQT